MIPLILPFLSSESAAMRTEAADAIAQSLWPLAHAARAESDTAVVVRMAAVLRSRLAVEREPAVVASIAESLGRLPYRSEGERGLTEAALAELLGRTSDAEVAAGAARGIESLLRGAGRDHTPSAHTIELLRAIVRGESASGATNRGAGIRSGGNSADAPRGLAHVTDARWLDSAFAWPRRLALMALISSRAADTALVRSATDAADPQLRRLAVLAAGTLTDSTASHRIVHALLSDHAPMVRIEAARTWSRIGGTECAPLLRLALDSAPQASVTAIDAIGTGCGAQPGSEAESTLIRLILAGTSDKVVNAGPSVPARLAMHRAAHAMVALARVSPAKAAALIGRVVSSRAWQARMYAARAAAVLADSATLVALSSDTLPNVRTEAITGLAQVVGHAADSTYIAALSSGDYQLVLTAAQALRGTPHRAGAVSALVNSLARITTQKRETSRDPRMAILQTLREIGSAELAGPLMPYLADFDPAVADTAAAMVSQWAGRTYRSAPRPLPSVDGPPDDPASLRNVRVRVTMSASSGGGSFEIRLFPSDAPATVSRFVQLVRAGYYNGLTIHRVVPDFVVQGGSPGANEYMGDGPFMRDEVGVRSHRRGVLGISTRGRGTGDAQFFVNLVDNPRLDHDYTVFAEVVSGMAIVDQLLEGDVMRSVELVAKR